jgi:hypothetical protein
VAPSLLASATDADGDTLTLVWHSRPAYGTLTVAPDGSFVYVPFDFVGRSSRADSFTFNVSDGQGGITQGVVSLTICERPEQWERGDRVQGPQRQGVIAPHMEGARHVVSGGMLLLLLPQVRGDALLPP